jgi:hypothetical protein
VKPLNLSLALVFLCISANIAAARIIAIWPYQQLLDKADFVAIATPISEIDYRRNVMAGMRWTNEWINEAETPNKEFLFLIEKS